MPPKEILLAFLIRSLHQGTYNSVIYLNDHRQRMELVRYAGCTLGANRKDIVITVIVRSLKQP